MSIGFHVPASIRVAHIKTLDDVLPDDAVIHLPNSSAPITGRDVKDTIRRELINIVSTSPLTWDDLSRFTREGEPEA